MKSIDPRSRRRGYRVKHFAVLVVLALCAAVPAYAQDAVKIPLVGVLRINTAATNEPGASMLRDALAAVGRLDGRNLRLEFRLAEGHVDRYPELADRLVRDGASVIIAYGTPPVRAAQHATTTIPIVAVAYDLVDAGFITSLAKPGGNITGVSILSPELATKKLDILKEIVPAARRFGVLKEPALNSPKWLQAIADAARMLGVELQTIDVTGPADFAPAFTSFRAGGVEAVILANTATQFSFPKELGGLIRRDRLPAIGEFRHMAEAGCVASYGYSLSELYATVAALTDKMLKGARPAETPAHQPTRFDLVINQQAARAIGIEIPTALLARASEIIE
jgi:putative ABC transport system substrate-binding protein